MSLSASLFSSLEGVLDHPEEFYKPNAKVHSTLATVLKQLYDVAKINEPKGSEGNGLSELHVKGFDEEQIWTQMQQFQQPLNGILRTKTDENLDLLKNNDFDLVIEGLFEPEEDGEDDDDEETKSDSGVPSGEQEDGEEAADNNDDQEENAEVADNIKAKAKNTKASASGAADDNVDYKEFKQKLNPDDVQDFIQSLEQHVDDMDEEKLDDEALAELYGEDFDEDEDDEDKKRGDDEEQEEDEDGYFDEAGKLKKTRDDEAVSRDEEKTFFEKHQEEVMREMEKLEEQNVGEKPWQQRGEVPSHQRPQNSLLEEAVVFEHAAKSKPIITEEMTKDLESIIISRIVSGIFDDPKRPSEDEGQKVRKDVELKHEKSKKSLAELYEEKYVQMVHGINPNEDDESEEVKKKKDDMRFKVATVLHTLNMMSSFHYVAPPVRENFATAKSQKATPSITVEENVPISVADSTLQAPEEIMKPITKLTVGESETTQEDRKKKRKRSKEKTKKNAKKAKLMLEAANPGKYHKDQLIAEIEQKKKKEIEKSADPTKLKGKNKLSSKTFFANLQSNLSKYGAKSAPKQEEAPKKVQRL